MGLRRLTVLGLLFYSTENQEKEDKAKEETPLEPEAKEKPVRKPRRSGDREESPAFMASFFAGLEVYKTKMLVSRAQAPFFLPVRLPHYEMLGSKC